MTPAHHARCAPAEGEGRGRGRCEAAIVASFGTLQHDPRTPRKGRALRSRILPPSQRTTWSLELATVTGKDRGAGGGPFFSRLYEPPPSGTASAAPDKHKR